jgi:hypothetical protein
VGLGGGIPKLLLLRWAADRMREHPGFHHVELDEAFEMLFFTVRAGAGVERRHRLTIERGQPVVRQVEGPPES